MDDVFELSIKQICCTCLSVDRKLFQLCRITDGINNLYSLLSHDSEAYREGFYKNSANLFICWECRALMGRLCRFRVQACVAQKQLTCIADGRNDVKSHKHLSRLSIVRKTSYDQTYTAVDHSDDCNFIVCGFDANNVDIKVESDEDIPLSELHNNYVSDNINLNGQLEHISLKTTSCDQDMYKKKKKTKMKCSKKNEPTSNEGKNYFTTTAMSEKEMLESRQQMALAVTYVDAARKCESCVEGFKSDIDLEKHNTALHSKKEHHTQCDICLSYIQDIDIHEHTLSHYQRHSCAFCDYVSHSVTAMLGHLKSDHAIQNLEVPVKRKKGQRKTEVLKPGSKPRRNQAMMDKRTPFGYLCTECNMYFDNKNQRWKHVQRHHREGFKCATCGKRFAFKNNLTRHEQLHVAPPPREQCAVCGKLVRADLSRAHARIHAARTTHACAPCGKRFVSRASYEHHLKYARAHARTDVLRYKCPSCDKGYRSRGELRDHVNYRHMGKTQHQCPICGKALATRRCITRHVRRAHHGVKENARDKICQQCGKAFRDKKGLREHEAIHTGERPLSCEICGCTFRQSASLYTHRKRVHKIQPTKKIVQIVESEGVTANDKALSIET